MNLELGALNWLAIVACVIVGQVILTLWFTVLFGNAWARAYGAKDRAQHTREVPPYTYAIGLAGVIAVTIGTALLHKALSITGAGAGIGLGLFLAVVYGLAVIIPGYAFLKKLDGGLIAAGSQAVLIVVVSGILAIWG